jgi:hypothetical protein
MRPEVDPISQLADEEPAQGVWKVAGLFQAPGIKVIVGRMLVRKLGLNFRWRKFGQDIIRLQGRRSGNRTKNQNRNARKKATEQGRRWVRHGGNRSGNEANFRVASRNPPESPIHFARDQPKQIRRARAAWRPSLRLTELSGQRRYPGRSGGFSCPTMRQNGWVRLSPGCSWQSIDG